MANRFCAGCGAKLLTNANFCVECGERQPGAPAPRGGWSIPWARIAPLLVVLAVVAVGGGAVLYGVMAPKKPAGIPGSEAGGGEGQLPAGHPPITIPDQVKQAISDLKKKADGAPDDLKTWKQLAEVEYRAGQIDHSYLSDAVAAYKHVLKKEPDNLDVIRNLGNLAFDQDQQDVAIGYYQEYLKRKPDDLNVKTDLGTMYLSAGHADKAIDLYNAVLTARPSFFQAEFNLAIAYRSVGNNDKAIAALEKARTMAPDDRTRSQVDQLLAQAKGEPVTQDIGGVGAPGAGAPGAEASTGGGGAAASASQKGPAAGSFQEAAESLFRHNPIMGPKVDHIEWSGPDTAKVYFHDFPMAQMPPQMRSMFTDLMKKRIKEAKEAHKVTQTARFDLIDAASGKVMDTLTE